MRTQYSHTCAFGEYCRQKKPIHPYNTYPSGGPVVWLWSQHTHAGGHISHTAWGPQGNEAQCIGHIPKKRKRTSPPRFLCCLPSFFFFWPFCPLLWPLTFAPAPHRKKNKGTQKNNATQHEHTHDPLPQCTAMDVGHRRYCWVAHTHTTQHGGKTQKTHHHDAYDPDCRRLSAVLGRSVRFVLVLVFAAP